MKQIVVDANAFLRLFLNDIPKQADEVEKLFEQAKEDKVKIIIPQIIVFEIVFALEKYYHFPKQEINEKLKSIVAANYLKIQNKEVFKKSLEFFEQEKISLADCFIASYVKYKDITLFTFDKNLKKLIKRIETVSLK